MTRSYAVELGPYGITVNSVAPGFIATDMTSDLPEDVTSRILDQVPLGRMGRPEEVAAACAYFASEDAGYVTAQLLGVNGGTAV